VTATTEKPELARSDLPPGKIVVVMPARNAGKTLERTYGAIPSGWVDEVILVDDKSTDDTVAVARTLPLHVIWHPHNVGYGGNQKTCYLWALQHDAEVVVMLHPDGQYEPTTIPKLVEPILRGEADLVLGSRLADGPRAALKGGMPLWKLIANRGLTVIENAVLGTELTEMHSGLRAYSRDLLINVPFLRNALDFSFDSEMLMQASHFGYRLAEVPTRTIYFDDASSVGFKPSVIYGLETVWAGVRLMLHRAGIWRSRKYER
jgi:glycosyltransferase involved in cell wall biosynthesis